mmetsp:Transcript_18256/g.36999  ORF Transcript_18256/g.36999 Transcript_18256/m.36999 type:complete len:135 (+) Transcript_18256:283-687(+)
MKRSINRLVGRSVPAVQCNAVDRDAIHSFVPTDRVPTECSTDGKSIGVGGGWGQKIMFKRKPDGAVVSHPEGFRGWALVRYRTWKGDREGTSRSRQEPEESCFMHLLAPRLASFYVTEEESLSHTTNRNRLKRW